MAKIILGESNNSEIIKSINGKSALAEENTFTKKNTFLVAPECDVSATSDKELVNLKTLKDNLSNLNINTSDFAKLKLANSFSEDNNFLKRVFLKNNTPSPNLGSATILSDTNNNGFISFMKNVYNTYTNVLVKMGILDGTANNTFEFKADNDVTGFKFNKNVIIENATEDNHALNRITADKRFIRRDIEDTLDNQLNFNVLPKSNVDATEDSHFVNLKTLNAKLAGGAGGSVNLSNVPKLDTDNTFTGNNVFNNPLVVGNATLDTHALNRGEADKRYGVKLLTNNITWTVGTGGDFTDLQDAITEASKYIGMKDRYIFIKIKNGYTLSRGLTINGINCTLFIQGENGKTDELILQSNDVDLMFINVTQNSQEVIFNNITVKAVGGKCSILADIGGILQVRDCIFKGTFETCLGANNRSQIYIINSLISTSYDKDCYFVTSHHGSTVKFDSGVQFKYDGSTGNCYSFSISSGANINTLWWGIPAISVTGKLKTALIINSGGMFFNQGMDFTGCTFSINKYPQVANQWTSNGYIAVN